MRFLRTLCCAAALALSGCSLLLDFDPEGQPCDAQNRCLAGYICQNKVCVSGSGSDGGVDGGTRSGGSCDSPEDCPEPPPEAH